MQMCFLRESLKTSIKFSMAIPPMAELWTVCLNFHKIFHGYSMHGGVADCVPSTLSR